MSDLKKKLTREIYDVLFSRILVPKTCFFGGSHLGLKSVIIKNLKFSSTNFLKSLIDFMFQISRLPFRNPKNLRVFKVLEIQASY